MGLFDRISRVVRANLNEKLDNYENNNFGESTAFIVGGTITGAGVSLAVGGMGLVSKYGSVGIGTVGLSTTGAVAGAAAYGAKKAIEDGDTSALGAAAAGAAVGAGVSAVTGGMGLAGMGTAVGIGMAPVTAAGAVAGLGVYGLSRLLGDGDPEKLLEQCIIDMQSDQIHLHQAVASALASFKRTEQQYNQAQNEANKWQCRAKLALQKGDENLARLALERKKVYAKNANALKASLEQQTTQVDTLKRSLIALSSKISEAKTKKDMLKARISAALAQEQLQGTVGRLGTNSAMAAFERMEEKIMMQLARAQAADELVGGDLESQFAVPEQGSDIDDELAALKALISLPPGTTESPPSLPRASDQPALQADDELERLRKLLDQL